MLSPLLVMVLAGILSYGGYFWLAHSVQQTANDSARAAIAGINVTERTALANQSMIESASSYTFLRPADLHVTVAESATAITVTVVYDASHSPFWVFRGLLPMPSSTIARSAAVRLGGY